MKKTIRILCLLLCFAFLSALFGCGAKRPAVPAGGVDLRETLSALIVRDDVLGIAGKYASVSDVADGSVDPELVGSWYSADGDLCYSYAEDGILTVEQKSVRSVTTIPFTCITASGHNILCEDLIRTTYADDGEPTESTVLQYTAYLVRNDALYCVSVESVSDAGDSAVFSLVIMFKADETGSFAASAEKNRTALASLYGTWKAVDGKLQFVFDENGLTVTGGAVKYGKRPLSVSFNDRGQLVVETGDGSSAYDVNLSYRKTYMYEDRKSVDEEGFLLALSYTGADGSDKPNLAGVMTDWKMEYDYDQWVYNVDLTLVQ